MKDPTRSGGLATIHYTDIGDYLSRVQKLERVAAAGCVTTLESEQVTPNKHGDWLHQRRDDFASFLPIGEVFHQYGRGVETARDAWVYNASVERLEKNVQLHVNTYEQARQGILDAGEASDPQRISWSRALRADLPRGRTITYNPARVQTAMYRPFMKSRLYFDRSMNNVIGAMARCFPTRAHANIGFYVIGVGATAEFSLLCTDSIPDVQVLGAGQNGQFFARSRYVKAGHDLLAFDDAEDGEVFNGYRRLGNVTDGTITRFEAAYGPTFTKDDVFYYCYGLLHSPDYRETYAADLKKMLPRIPLVSDAKPYVHAGRRLAGLQALHS